MALVFILLLLIALSNSVVVNQTCSTSGKFVADYNCTSYAVCIDSTNGSFTSYNIMCPAGFVVRHSDMVCFKGGDVCNSNYKCTNIGNYTDPSSTNSSTYISCIQGLGDMIIATVMDCPLNYTFNDTLRVCVNHTVSNITDLNVTTQAIPVEVSTQTIPLVTTQLVPDNNSSTQSVPLDNTTKMTPIANTTQEDPATPTPSTTTTSTDKPSIILPVTAATMDLTPRLNSAAYFDSKFCVIISSLISFYLYYI